MSEPPTIVLFDDIHFPLNFDLEGGKPEEVMAKFLREICELRLGVGFGADELIEVAQQLDGGEGP